MSESQRMLFGDVASPAPEPEPPAFGGETYDPEQDESRLRTALGRVWLLMRDGVPRTLQQIATAVGCSEAGASARLRDLRKSKWQRVYAVQAVESERVAGGLWMYRVVAGDTCQLQ